MDECPGDSSVSASPRGPPWRPRRPHFQLRCSNSLPSQPPFTLCCLFVRRAPAHRKRRFPECPELETITGSVFVFRGKRGANSALRRALHGPLEGVYSSKELQPSERGSGQYLTSEAFWSWVPFSCTPRECGASSRQRVCPKAGRLCAGGVVAETKDVCARGGGGCQRGVFLSSGKLQTNHYTERAKASRGHGRGGRCVGRSPCRLFDCSRRLRRL